MLGVAEVFVLSRIYWYGYLFDDVIITDIMELADYLRILYLTEMFLIAFMIYIQVAEIKDEKSDVGDSLKVSDQHLFVDKSYLQDMDPENSIHIDINRSNLPSGNTSFMVNTIATPSIAM